MRGWPSGWDPWKAHPSSGPWLGVVSRLTAVARLPPERDISWRRAARAVLSPAQVVQSHCHMLLAQAVVTMQPWFKGRTWMESDKLLKDQKGPKTLELLSVALCALGTVGTLRALFQVFPSWVSSVPMSRKEGKRNQGGGQTPLALGTRRPQGETTVQVFPLKTPLTPWLSWRPQPGTCISWPSEAKADLGIAS